MFMCVCIVIINEQTHFIKAPSINSVILLVIVYQRIGLLIIIRLVRLNCLLNHYYLVKAVINILYL